MFLVFVERLWLCEYPVSNYLFPLALAIHGSLGVTYVVSSWRWVWRFKLGTKRKIMSSGCWSNAQDFPFELNLISPPWFVPKIRFTGLHFVWSGTQPLGFLTCGPKCSQGVARDWGSWKDFERGNSILIHLLHLICGEQGPENICDHKRM